MPAANAFFVTSWQVPPSLGLPGQSIAWGACRYLAAEEQREQSRGAACLESGTELDHPNKVVKALTLVRQDITTGRLGRSTGRCTPRILITRPPFLEELGFRRLPTRTYPARVISPPFHLLSQIRQLSVVDWRALAVVLRSGEIHGRAGLPKLSANQCGLFDLGMDSLMWRSVGTVRIRSLAGELWSSNTAVFDLSPNLESLGHPSGMRSWPRP